MEMLLLMVAMFAIFYFLMIRPQQKKMRAEQEMRSQLAEGDRVLLTSGVFGTIAHVGERQMIIELAPGVEITILKGNVARKVLPEDEEFEFTDEASSDASAAELQVDAQGNDLTKDSFDTMFDPRSDEAVAEEISTDEVAPDGTETTTDEVLVDETHDLGNDSGYQPWERREPGASEPQDGQENRPEDTK